MCLHHVVRTHTYKFFQQFLQIQDYLNLGGYTSSLASSRRITTLSVSTSVIQHLHSRTCVRCIYMRSIPFIYPLCGPGGSIELLFANARLKEKLVAAFVHKHPCSSQLFFSAWLVYRSIQCRRDLARSCKQGAEKVAVEREVSSVSTHSLERAEIDEARTQ